MTQAVWVLLSSFLTIALSFWTLLLTLVAISEAHKFSLWRAVATYIIPGLLLIVLLFFFIFVIALLV